MSIYKMEKLRIEPSVKEFMRDFVKTLLSRKEERTRERNVSCIKCNRYQRKTKRSDVHFENRNYIEKLCIKPFEKAQADSDYR